MKITKILGFSFCIGMSIAAHSQSALDQYIEEGLKSNQQLLQETLAVENSKLSLSEAKGMYFPSVNLQSDYTLADGGRSINFPIGDLLNPVYGTLNNLTGTDQFPTIDNVNEQFLPNNFYDTKVRVIQPLFNSDIYYNQKAQQQLLKVSEAKRSTYEEELKKEIKIAYFNYWQVVQALSIYESNLEVLQALVNFNQKRYQADQITIDEVYRAQFEVAQLQAEQSNAEAQAATAQAYFNFLLNRNHDADILEDQSLNINPLLAEETLPMMEEVVNRRQEMTQIRSAQEAQFQAIRLAQGSRLPQVNAVFDMGYQGEGYQFGSEENYWLLNLGFSWNIFSGFRNAKRVEKARVSLDVIKSQEQQLRQQIALEVTRANTSFTAARQQYRSRQLALKSAKKSFEIISSKYRESQALLVQYLDARSASLSSELELNVAKYRLMSARAQLDRALAY